MTDDRAEDGAQQRIEELEQEVARLRSEMEEGRSLAEDGEEDAVREADATPLAPDDSAVVAMMPSKTRAIVIAVAIAVAALVGILFITYGLSSVIKPFSRKAARFISPWEPVEKPAPKQPESPPPIKDDIPRAPGL